jgi:histidinol-phosphate aminotransferase
MSRFLSSGLDRLAPYVPGEQPQISAGLIKLNTNENPYPPGAKVRAALADLESDDLRLYPDPDTQELIAAAASVFGLQHEQVIAGNGSDELLAFCFQGFCGNGAAFPDISYGFYAVWANLYEVAYRQIALKEDFSLDIDAYLGLKETLFIANPNAPTGRAISTEEIEALLRQDQNRLVIIDEAYADFASDNALGLIDKYDNLLIIRTMSKGYSLAGARIGFALGNSDLIADLAKIKYSFNPYNINRLSLACGCAALLDQDYFRLCRNRVLTIRKDLSRQLADLGWRIIPSQANFIFAGEHPLITAADYASALKERQIFIRHFFSKGITDFVRISIGTEAEMAAFLAASESILKEAAR